MRTIATAVMNLSLVLIPVALLVWGIIIADSSYWQYTLGIGIAAFACFTYERYMQAKKSGKMREEAKFFVAVFGVAASFFLLLLQVMFCGMTGARALPLECSLGWMMLLGSVYGFRMLARNRPEINAIGYSAALGFSFMAIVVIGVVFDLFEHFSGMEVPELIGNFFGWLAPITAVGCLVCLFIGMAQDKMARR
ncbi:MAG: hypothetical protein IJS88_05930 [Alphaproteobacteria bacterium]|nr:hypothetical protein [Alphaproteobacteria bacterium]